MAEKKTRLQASQEQHEERCKERLTHMEQMADDYAIQFSQSQNASVLDASFAGGGGASQNTTYTTGTVGTLGPDQHMQVTAADIGQFLFALE